MDPGTPWWNAPIVGGFPATPARIALGLAVVLLGWFVSRLLGQLGGRWAAGGRLEPGARYAVGRLLNYLFIVISFSAGLAVMGIDMRSLAVVAGALGIGIGLGLQSITANFVAGIVLLFERPIQPGDRVSLGNAEQEATGAVNGYVRAIRLRSTTIQTPDNILLIVPNADLVGRTIVNWSHGDPKMRIRMNVGVSYASDLDLVQRLMLAAAVEHPGTLKSPEPEVRLVATADSSLDFQVLVWIPDPRERGRVESSLRLDIVRRFREAGVEIPFPQREVRVVRAEGGTVSAATRET